MSLKVRFKRKISVRVLDDKVILTVPVVRNYFFLALLILISYIWFTKSFRFLTPTLPSFIDEYTVSKGVLLGLWGAFSIALVSLLVWGIWGAEVITVDKDNITAKARGRLFYKKRVFKIKLIIWIKLYTFDNLLTGEVQHDKKYKRFKGGKIRIKYSMLPDEKALGVGLSTKEAVDFLDILALKGFLDERLWVYKKTSEDEYYN